MGGVAGHAGLFTTAEDLAKFAEMMLNLGEYNGVRIFSPLTGAGSQSRTHRPINPFCAGSAGTSIHPSRQPRRTLSAWLLRPHRFYWHVDLDRSFNQDLRHPDEQQRASHARIRPRCSACRVATIAAAAIGIDAPGSILATPLETAQSAPARVTGRTVETLNGVDVLALDGFSKLKGKRIGSSPTRRDCCGTAAGISTRCSRRA